MKQEVTYTVFFEKEISLGDTSPKQHYVQCAFEEAESGHRAIDYSSLSTTLDPEKATKDIPVNECQGLAKVLRNRFCAVRAIATPNTKQSMVWILLDWELTLQHG